MEIAAVAIQQTSAQLSAALSMVKTNAQAEQSLVNVIAQSSPGAGRGQNLDINV